MSQPQTDYSAKDIQVLEGLDPVRKRPGMYIGSTGLAGLHHLIWEVVDNAVDEAMAGPRQPHRRHAPGRRWLPRRTTTVAASRSTRIRSGPHKGKSTVEVVLTVLHAGGKFGGSGYKVSGGLHGVGVSVVNALSERLVVEVDRDGTHYRQEFAKGGKAADEARERRQRRRASRTGTTVTFWPDPDGVRRRGRRVRAPAPCSSGCRRWPSSTRASRSASVDERPGQGAEGHVPLRRRHRRLREAPERVEGGAVQERRAATRSTRRTSRSRWPCSGTPGTTRASTATPTASPPPRAACTSRASARRSPAWSTTTPAPASSRS